MRKERGAELDFDMLQICHGRQHFAGRTLAETMMQTRKAFTQLMIRMQTRPYGQSLHALQAAQAARSKLIVQGGT